MNNYPNTPQAVLDSINALVPTLPGWVTPERGCELADAIFESKPKICVELGVFGGRSLVSQAFALKHADYGGVVAGIDPWRKEDALEDENPANQAWWSKVDLDQVHLTCMQAIWQHGLESHVSVIRNASQYAAPLFGEIDMLFIDGNHAEGPSTRDVENYVPKVRKGGYIFTDDADWSSTKPAYDRIKEMADLVKVGSEIVNGVEVTGRYLVLRKK